MIPDPADCFSADYTQARQKFLAALAAAGGTHEAYLHPTATGPHGEALYVDVGRIGPANASKILVVSSGVHGIEGFAGSAAQTHALEQNLFLPLPPDTAILFVHGVNPYGFAHGRRVNEDNVDLNRNFIDWLGALPSEHPLTAAANAEILPDPWQWPPPQLLGLLQKNGLPQLQAAFSQGQYRFPDGLFYGGAGPAWSNEIWHDILHTQLAGCRAAAHVDIHTGLGPSGHGELIFSGPSSDTAHARATKWWGDVKSMADGASVSAVLTGDITTAFNEAAQGASVVSVALEFGTQPPMDVLEALALDNYIHIKGGDASLTRSAHDKMRAAFNPDDPAWRRAVIARSEQVLWQALDGLAPCPPWRQPPVPSNP